MNNIQDLLDLSARLGNEKLAIDARIKELRGDNPPPCWGQDDCGVYILARCPWRIDCGDS